MSVLLPGALVPTDGTITRIGPGLHTLPDLQATKAGLLFSSPKSHYLETSQRRYCPAQNDSVIGQITARFAEGYRVDIASSIPAQLDALAFFNVNRKNKPNLGPGDLVYARISSQINTAVECELTCLTPENKAGPYGPLQEETVHQQGEIGTRGTLLKDLPLGFCRRLLDPDDQTLAILGEKVEYEVVVGMNGRIWIQAQAAKTVLFVAKVLTTVEAMTESQVRAYVAERLGVFGL